MRPGNRQLLQAMLSEVTQARMDAGGIDTAALLDSVEAGLNELLLRYDRRFFDDLAVKGHALAAEAAAILGEQASGAQEGKGIDMLLASNAALTERLMDRQDAPSRDLVRRIMDWELSLYAKRTEKALTSDGADAGFAQLTAENFETYLRRRRPEWPNPKVLSFKRQPGGYSKITILVQLHDDANGEHGVVIRAQPTRPMLDLEGMSVAAEYPVVRYAYEAGLPVAEPLWLEPDSSHIGFAFMLSRRVPGRVAGSFVGATSQIDETQVRDILALIARIANTPLNRDDPLIQASHLPRWLAHADLASNTREFVEYWRDVGTRGHSLPSALLNYAVRWLLDNVPTDQDEAHFIHGDVGFHNVLFDEGRITAILDWENSRVGDTAEELSMFVSSIAHLHDHATILRWYHEAGGPAVSEWRLRYFDVYMAMKIIVSAQVSLQRVEEAPQNNLRLGVFGLRFLHMIGSRLPELIRLAEEAKAKDL